MLGSQAALVDQERKVRPVRREEVSVESESNGKPCPCGCGIEFTELEGAIGRVLFHEMDHHGASLIDVQQALASTLWGMLGGYDGDTLTRVVLYRHDDDLRMDVIEMIDGADNTEEN